MKKAPLLFSFILLLISSFTIANAQDSIEKLNLPGDNLNLYAVLKIFQESPTLESFEKSLNDPDSKVNNLDLNNDNEIDYIKVIDHIDGDVHNIVLQDITSNSENQDVAVVVVQKLKDNQVQIQIIGDEDLYGKNYIVEPNFEADDLDSKSTPNPGYTPGGNKVIVVERTSKRAIYDWPIVRVIYLPNYVVWASPWYWGYYPVYWHPWRPYFWHEYYGWHYHWNYYYYAHFRRWKYCRYNRWNSFYYGSIRIKSPYFYKIKRQGVFVKTYTRPDLMSKGSNDFKNKFPNAPSAHENLPKNQNVRNQSHQTIKSRQNRLEEKQEPKITPHIQNRPQLKNNERRDEKREPPIRNRPNENRKIDKKRELPEKQQNQSEGNLRKGGKKG
jgi:hypothetical protein